MGRVSHAKELVHKHGFQLMERHNYLEIYRRGNQFLMRNTPVVDGVAGEDTWGNPAWTEQRQA